MNAERDPEAAAWERARQLRAQREEADRNQRAEREQAAAATVEEDRRRERSNDRRVLVLWVGALAAVGALVAIVILVVANTANDGASDNDGGDAVDSADVTEATENRLAPVGPISGSSGETGRRASPSLDADTPPVVDLTGDNFDRVWRQAQVLEGWLLRHPRPELVDQIYTPGTETYAEVHTFIEDLAVNGHILVVEDYRIGDIELVARPSPDEVELRYTDTYAARDLVDGMTNAVLEHEASDGQARAWTVLLERAPQGPWRVTSITPATGEAP